MPCCRRADLLEWSREWIREEDLEARIQEALESPVPLYAGEWGERRVGEEGDFENDFDGFTSEDEEELGSEDEEDGAADGGDEQGNQEGNAYEEAASGKQPPRRAPGRRLVPADGL